MVIRLITVYNNMNPMVIPENNHTLLLSQVTVANEVKWYNIDIDRIRI